MAKKNKLIDLNDHLFEQLERMNDDGLKGDDLLQEIDRSKAMCNIAVHVVENARLALSACKAINDGLVKTSPEMFGLKSLT